MSSAAPVASTEVSPCTSCGACCAYSAEWPRFTLESDEMLDRIPAKLVNESLSGMRFEGERCMALVGKIGCTTSCSIYEMRPQVCRDCQPGDDACTMAREARGMAPIEVDDPAAQPAG
jgi:Fe-S-cluster containining protein